MDQFPYSIKDLRGYFLYYQPLNLLNKCKNVKKDYFSSIALYLFLELLLDIRPILRVNYFNLLGLSLQSYDFAQVRINAKDNP